MSASTFFVLKASHLPCNDSASKVEKPTTAAAAVAAAAAAAAVVAAAAAVAVVVVADYVRV